MPGYYSAGLEQVQVDGDVLFGLLKKSSNVTYKHLKKQRVDPILIMMEWFMCVFSRTLPWPSVLRVSLQVFERSGCGVVEPAEKGIYFVLAPYECYHNDHYILARCLKTFKRCFASVVSLQLS